MIGVEVDTRPGAQLLAAVRGRVERPRPLLEALGAELVDRQRRAFATSGFGDWAPNAPATVRVKGHGRVMIDTGGLLLLMSRGSAVRVTSDSVELGVTHPGAHYNRVGARGMPRRDVVPDSTPAERQDWSRVALGFLASGARP